MERARALAGSCDAGLGHGVPWGQPRVLPSGTGSLGILAVVAFTPLPPRWALSNPHHSCQSPPAWPQGVGPCAR